MSSTYTSAAAFYRLALNYAQGEPSGALLHEVGPDEVYDLTLIAERVYGRRSEWFVVMAAAGMDSPCENVPTRRLYLPTETLLRVWKADTGYAATADERSDELNEDPIGAR